MLECIKKILLSRAQKKLDGFSFRNLPKEKVLFPRYEEFLPLIEKCYHDTEYWHGTGRYHYEYSIGSRNNKVSKEKYFDILNSFIENNGLIPHMDLFVPPWGESRETVSLTSCRMYARCYAEIHQYEKQPLLYVYGNLLFWWKVIIPLQIMEVLQNKPFKNYLPRLWGILKARSSFSRVSNWVSALRNDIAENGLPKFWRLHTIRSNIATNYGILVGTKRGSIETFSFDPAVERFEVRTCNKVSLSDITHIEVPLDMLEITRDFVKTKNVQLLIIPIEFGERYCSQYSIKELISEK